ncbi:amidase [Peribacillus sp. TH14]|uniref:amidase n=1 Tax=Peribacillus sp. TH14 TaxID=2798481 RepID=UPI0019142A0A|nr:amidase [Peribacillus sp. TH14]MBK5502501.1 amidase [Peribacillus sp. TH14]
MKFSEYLQYDGVGLAELVKSKEVTPEELIKTALHAIEEINPKLNAVVSIQRENAKRDLEALPNGPFKGVPFLIKEMALHASGIPSRMGSKLADGFVLPHDTELMARFRKAGFVTIGTTATPEFAFNATTESVLYGPSRNPWNNERSSGGSSGGSGAAVAAGIVPLAHANDGGGSIRIPASCNGLIGLKPTRGRIPTGPDMGEVLCGLGIEFALTRTMRDTAALLDAVSGPDLGCYAWAERPTTPYLKELSTPPQRLRIAWTDKPLSGVPVNPECNKALYETVRLCEELGHEVVETTPYINNEQHMLATVRLWTSNLANMMDNVAQFLGKNPSEENLEATSWACYQHGKSMTAVELLQALDIMNMVSRTIGDFFKDYDVLLTPTTGQPPLLLGQLNANAPGVSAEQWTEQIFTYAPFTNVFNTTGQPAISLPLAWSHNGLPIGMQFAGRFGEEATLLKLARQIEEARPWKDHRPPMVKEFVESQG